MMASYARNTVLLRREFPRLSTPGIAYEFSKDILSGVWLSTQSCDESFIMWPRTSDILHSIYVQISWPSSPTFSLAQFDITLVLQITWDWHPVYLEIIVCLYFCLWRGNTDMFQVAVWCRVYFPYNIDKLLLVSPRWASKSNLLFPILCLTFLNSTWVSLWKSISRLSLFSGIDTRDSVYIWPSPVCLSIFNAPKMLYRPAVATTLWVLRSDASYYEVLEEDGFLPGVLKGEQESTPDPQFLFHVWGILDSFPFDKYCVRSYSVHLWMLSPFCVSLLRLILF